MTSWANYLLLLKTEHDFDDEKGGKILYITFQLQANRLGMMKLEVGKRRVDVAYSLKI